jgi:ATP-dependent DNA helicase PIF1
MVTQLNEGQRAAYDQIMASVNDNNNSVPHQYFLDGPGGTGKTFLYNTLITDSHHRRFYRHRFYVVD